MEIKKVFLKIFYMFLLFLVAVVGCKTTAPTLGYIKPSEEILKVYGNRHNLPYDGAYLDYGKDGGHTTKRVILAVYDQSGNSIYKGENSGTNAFGRILDNAGTFMGPWTFAASPFFRYFGDKTRDVDKTNVNMSGGDPTLTAIATSGK